MTYFSPKILAAATLALAVHHVDAAEVAPPKLPRISPELTDEQIEQLTPREQPAALKAELTALAQGSTDERKARLKAYVLSHFVAVEGGHYDMGDFGPKWDPRGLFYTYNKDDKVLHSVTLSSFGIQAYKTTYSEFDVYSDATGQTRAGMSKRDYEGVHRSPFNPAGADWPQAQGYCRWLGNLLGMEAALPTEAQWEYAARSRGQYFIFATDDGNLDFGRNMANAHLARKLDPTKNYFLYIYPIGLFPPTPLGLYDMGLNGYEWMADYYDADYYAHSPEQDPQGPASGTERVLRGASNGYNYMGGITMKRRSAIPIPEGSATAIETGVRCVINQPPPLKIQPTAQ